jgi:hypothetical protein
VYYLPSAEIEHLGRISSRANRPFTYRTYECGYARYVGKHFGRGRARVYKLLVTLDLPLRIAKAFVQLGWHRLRGETKKADRSGDLLVASASFMLRGLARYWRA